MSIRDRNSRIAFGNTADDEAKAHEYQQGNSRNHQHRKYGTCPVDQGIIKEIFADQDDE
ncbi:hypothetical protein D3C72_2440940 [compost metagenome]